MFEKNYNLIIDDPFEEVLVYILRHNPTATTLSVVRINNSNVQFPLKSDGFYTICKLTVPINEAEPYYYKNGKFYHNIQEVELKELIGKVKTEYSYYMSTSRLRKCFINVCEEIFKQSSSICNTSADHSLTYKRDLLWSVLNVILYMADFDQYEEALRLLEDVTACNGLCESNNCGCK